MSPPATPLRPKGPRKRLIINSPEPEDTFDALDSSHSLEILKPVTKKIKLEEAPTLTSDPLTQGALAMEEFLKKHKFQKIRKAVEEANEASLEPVPVKEPAVTPSAIAQPVPPVNGSSRKVKKSGTARPAMPASDKHPVTPTPKAKTKSVIPTRAPRKRATSANNLESPDDQNLPPPPTAPAPITPGRSQRKSLDTSSTDGHAPGARLVKSASTSKIAERPSRTMSQVSATSVAPVEVVKAAPSVGEASTVPRAVSSMAAVQTPAKPKAKKLVKSSSTMFLPKSMSTQRPVTAPKPARPVVKDGKEQTALVLAQKDAMEKFPADLYRPSEIKHRTGSSSQSMTSTVDRRSQGTSKGGRR